VDVLNKTDWKRVRWGDFLNRTSGKVHAMVIRRVATGIHVEKPVVAQKGQDEKRGSSLRTGKRALGGEMEDRSQMKLGGRPSILESLEKEDVLSSMINCQRGGSSEVAFLQIWERSARNGLMAVTFSAGSGHPL